MPIQIISESELRSCVFMDAEGFRAIADGFTEMARGNVTLPPILRIDIEDHRGEVDVKTAYIHGLESFAIKIAAGFLENYRLGLPTGSGMMVLVSAETGRPIALLLDNGYLTDLRTGLAGAVAADFLCRQEITTAGVIGSGTQARFQIRGLAMVRSFERLLVYGIEPDAVVRYTKEMRAELGIDVQIAESAEAVVRNSDVVVTCTPSREPYLRADWLHPGLHLTCMGSDSEDKQEVHTEVFEKVDRIVCDQRDQCFRLGELHHALEAGILSQDSEIFELGELTSGEKPGRLDDSQITFCDLTGVGVQDTMIARLAYQKASELGLGIQIEGENEV